MKRFKKAFGRLFFRYPEIMEYLKIALIICVIFFIFLLLFREEGRKVMLAILTFLFLGLNSLVSYSKKWSKKLPEYFLFEAEKILESDKKLDVKKKKNIVYDFKLKFLTEQVELNGSEEKLEELKIFLKKVIEYRSLRENIENLYDREAVIKKLRDKKIEKWLALKCEISVENKELEKAY